MANKERLMHIVGAKGCWNGTVNIVELAERLDAAGVVALPCKVGTVVYVINRHQNAVYECTVVSVQAGYNSDSKNYIKTRWRGKHGNESVRKWTFRQIGVYVFMTRHDAETALLK